MRRYWYQGEHVTFQLAHEHVVDGYHVGACDDDIAYLRKRAYIRRTLDRLPADDVRLELKSYGSWDAAALADDDENLSRLLWLACAQIYADDDFQPEI